MKGVISALQVRVEQSHSAWRQVEGMDELARLPGYTVLTTLNGYQWSGTSTMTFDELEVYIAELQDYVRENKP